MLILDISAQDYDQLHVSGSQGFKRHRPKKKNADNLLGGVDILSEICN